MWRKKAVSRLSKNQSYSRTELMDIFRSENKDLTDSTFRWILYQLLRDKELYKTGYDSYTTMCPHMLQKYRPVYSDGCKQIMNFLGEKFPELDYIIFESVLLNEFLNHQIAQNTIYIQVEKELSRFVFDFLKDECPKTLLYKPSVDYFNLYWSKDCIVILDLVSQSPVSPDNAHEIMIEKMLVDIIAEKTIAATYSPSENPDIFEYAEECFQLDMRKMNRYAGRRGKAEEIRKYMGGN